MTVQTQGFFIPVEDYINSLLPANLVQLPQIDAFSSVWMQPLNIETDPSLSVSTALLFDTSLAIGIPGLDAVSVVIAPDGNETVFLLKVTTDPVPALSVVDVPIALRFGPDLLKPVRRVAGQGGAPDTWEVDTSVDHVDITLAKVTITGDVDGNFSLQTDLSIDMPAAMIGDSGVVIEAKDIGLYLDATKPPPGKPAGWRGVHIGSASLHLPGGLSGTVGTLSMTDCYIGNGGFSGTVSDTWTPALKASIGGMDCALEKVEITFVQNALTAASITGSLTLPFFDHPVDVEIGFGLNGTFSVGLSDPSGVFTLTKDGVLSLAVESLGFEVKAGVSTVHVSGTLTPLVGGLSWPGVKLKELSIDSHGNVHLGGGWISLPSQYSLDFFGFHVAITKLGMGSNGDGSRWIGFSGSIKLIEGLSIGGSVDGLKITWHPDGSQPPTLTLNNVAVELDIPDVMRFKGSVDYHELNGGAEKRFDGNITLELLALDMRVDGTIVIGRDDTDPSHPFTFFALYVGVQLPAGIPLWSTGLALYGIAGLVAIEMGPNKGLAPNPANEEWFQNADGTTPGWYLRNTPGVTDLKDKWDPLAGGFALGGGVTIGTLPDNGYTFSGAVLLVISFPGPVILIEGKANMLKERAALTDNPIFRALAVLDFRAGDFLFAVAAAYKYGNGGELIDIRGSAEAYFDFHDGSKWHLYLGQKDPKALRIRAQIIKIFEANAYFMLNADQLAMGVWIGWDKHWNFGPVSIAAEAWIQGDAVLSWKPGYLDGALWLHGKAELKVFSIGFGLSVDAKFAADVFSPFDVKAELDVGVSLPWPLPSFNVDLTLEWGPQPGEPPLPLPLKEIAIEHFKSTTSWPLPRAPLAGAPLLVPNLDAGGGFLPPLTTLPAPPLTAGPPADAPVVPMDARPHLTFGRSVHDDALVGVNPQPVWPTANPAGYEQIGDPTKNQSPFAVRYGVQEITLSSWNGTGWVDVARKAATANAPGVRELYGSWAPVPQLPAGIAAPGTNQPTAQVKLWLWSKTPFDYSLHGGQAWDEWFTAAHSNYPCLPPVPQHTVCGDFDAVPAGTALHLPVPFPQQPQIVLTGNVTPSVVELPAPAHGHPHALCFDAGMASPGPAIAAGARELNILVADGPAQQMTLVFADPPPQQQITYVDAASVTGKITLPFTWQVMVLNLADQTGTPLTTTNMLTGAGRTGIDMTFHATLDLPAAATWAAVTLVQLGSPVTLTACDATGAALSSVAAPTARDSATELVVTGTGITRLVIDAPLGGALIAQVGYSTTVPGTLSVQATAFDSGGVQHGPFTPDGDTITVAVANMTSVQLSGTGRICLAQACVTFPPDPGQAGAYTDMAQRLADSLTLWGQQSEVLAPDTAYRLAVVTTLDAKAGTAHIHQPTLTELAYFRTQGPPALAALSAPVLQVNPGDTPDRALGDTSGLGDLTRYVSQTVPPTVPAPGQRPLLPRPVYRAYDVGAVFNEDYVDLMYRLAKRDLYLYLYNANNQPVRDAAGRLIVSANRWGVTGSTTLTDSELRYLTAIDQSNCLKLNPVIISHSGTVSAADPGLVLDADTVYQARLVPLLRHDDFSEGLAGWTVVDTGTTAAPSAWQVLGHPELSGSGATVAGTTVTLTGVGDLSALVPGTDVVLLATDTARAAKTYQVTSVNNAAHQVTLDGAPSLYSGKSGWQVPGWGALTQTAGIKGGSAAAADAAKPGTMLIGGDPSWTDYRYTVQLRSAAASAIGIVFRYGDPGHYYRYSMDAGLSYRRLVRVSGGACTVLAQDDIGYDINSDYTVTVEAIGSAIRVYQDGTLVFDVTDTAFAGGQIGLYCWANPGARFSDVSLDDFAATAPVAYRFSFTTSQYATFHHHLHSYQDETWLAAAPGQDLSAEIAAATAPATAPSAAESAAFSSLAGKVLGAAAATPPATVEAHRITTDAGPAGLLVRSPEPIDWARTALTVSSAPDATGTPTVPGVVKLTELTASGTAANDETVTLLARDATTLAGVAAQTYGITGPLADSGGETLLDDTFGTAGGLLFAEPFGANALDSYQIVDAPGALNGPSHWAVTGGAITQTAAIFTNPNTAADPVKAGTVAVAGARWDNLRLTAVVSSASGAAIGVVIRYSDAANWYRFSMDSNLAYRRLVKCAAGIVTVLWEDHTPYIPGQAHEIRVDAFGDLLIGCLDGAALFAVRDVDVAAGQIGLYCWGNTGYSCTDLQAEALTASPLLFQPPLAASTELTVVDTGTVGGPSAWTAAGGAVAQTSAIADTAAGPLAAGTVALLSQTLADLALSVTLRSGSVGGSGGAIGVVFRYTDEANWYRFSMDLAGAFRRLVKCVGGTVTVVWQDNVAYNEDHDYALALTADGPRLTVRVDGTVLVDLTDSDLATGLIGMYSHANTAAHFSGLVVTDPARLIGAWRIVDDTTTASVWRVTSGELRQLSPAPVSTAVGGETTWDDYRVTATLRSDVPGAVGLVVRRQDRGNFYRLTLDASAGTRSLTKVTGGAATVLWHDSQATPIGQPLAVTVDALGARLVGYLNGQPLFDVTDGDHSAGQVGLYCSADPGARFGPVTVARPPLDAYAVFRDRFDVGDKSAWTIADDGTVSGPSAWAASAGELVQTSAINSPPTSAADVARRGTQALAGNPAWGDVAAAVRLTSTGTGALGLLFRYTDPDNFYRFSMDHQGGYRRLVACVAGTFSTLWQDATAYQAGHGYDLVVAAIGDRLTGWIDGVPVFDVTDARHASGRIGLYCSGNTGAHFSDVRVFQPDRLRTDLLLSADLAFQTFGQWTFQTQGDQAGPAVWQTAGGALRQTSGVWGGALSADELAKPGTLALAGDASWTDYRVTVQLSSGDPDAIGVAFRYADAANWYRFSMDHTLSYRRLVKCVGGTVSLLWQDAVAYQPGQQYLLTLDAVGDCLVGYLDGVELFSVRDSDLASGGIGLYCWHNPAAVFTSVQVTAAGWAQYYQFGPGEEPVPAGTRIAIHSGNAADWTDPPQPGLTHRFLAALLDKGHQHLPTDRPAELRVVDAAGAPGHTRRFLLPTEYTALPVRVLRKADGTEFAVVLPASSPPGAALPQAQYRLQLTYHRDNTAAVPGSTVLSRAGDSTDEIATLDIPWAARTL